MIGRTVGRYSIVSALGTGGMGTVWEAQDTLLGRRVALKFLAPTLAADQTARRRFLREARAVSALDHPGVATVYDAGEADGQIYIAFRRVEGRPLREHLGGKPLPVAEALRLSLQVARALEHAHSKNVVHGDVTGRNILVTAAGEAVLVDFGLARVEAAAGASPGSLVSTHDQDTKGSSGTAGYMAPEVAEGAPPDARSDVYGLGVVFYEMLTGALPFRGERAEALLYAAVHGEIKPPSHRRKDIPREVEEAVLRLMNRDPSERPASGREAAAALAEVEAEARLQSGEGASPRRRAAARKRLSDFPVGWGPLLRRASRPTALVGVTLLAAAAAFWLAMGMPWPGSLGSSREARPEAIRVAVLPFQDVSDDPRRTGYLASGVTQSLITRLSQVPGIQVTPWVTASRFTDPAALPPGALASELGVSWLVLGSLRRTEDQVRATISLIESSSGLQTWGDEVHVPFADLVAVQKALVGGLVRSLKGELTGADEEIVGRVPTSSTEAYNAYLRGQALLVREDEVSVRLAETLFSKAIELDADFALAYVGRGSVGSGRYFRGEGGAEDLRLAEADFRQALALDPDLSVAHRGLVHVYWQASRQEDCLSHAQEIRRRGLNDVDGMLARATAYMMCGLPADAVPLFHAALDLDPANAGALWFLVPTHAWAGEYDEAVQAGRRYLQRFGEDAEVHLWMGFARHVQGDLAMARRHYDAMDRLFSKDSDNMYYLIYPGILYARLGETAQARGLWRRGLEQARAKLDLHPDNELVQLYALVYAGLLGDMAMVDRETERILAMPGSSLWQFYLANVYIYHDRPDGALDLLRDWARYSPGFMSYARALGVLHLHGSDDFLQDPELKAIFHDVERSIARLRQRYGLGGSGTP